MLRFGHSTEVNFKHESPRQKGQLQITLDALFEQAGILVKGESHEYNQNLPQQRIPLFDAQQCLVERHKSFYRS